MTQKDYIKIAAVLNKHVPEIIKQGLIYDALLVDLANMFQVDNPRFDRGKFLEAVYKN